MHSSVLAFQVQQPAQAARLHQPVRPCPRPPPQLRNTSLYTEPNSPLRHAVPVPLHASLRILDLGNNPNLTWRPSIGEILCGGTGSSACYRRLVEL